MLKNYTYLILISLLLSYTQCTVPLKLLHLSFHKGCIREIKYIARELGAELTSIFVQDDWVKNNNYDGITKGNAIYNVSHQRAQDVWNRHKEFFNQFDAIITSDTAPLSRIFLQNGWQKPLIIWICNRFDYTDWDSSRQGFPDDEYYQLIRTATHQDNVFFVAYNAFEHHYGHTRGIDFGTRIITPSGKFKNKARQSMVPNTIDKAKTFFIPPRNNDVQLVEHCNRLGIPCYRGVYNGPTDLEGFKGVIHIPYAWSNLALFENIQLGLPIFIPTKRFMLELLSTRRAWWPNVEYMQTCIDLTEWYCPEHKHWFTFFDSWNDLKTKIDATDFAVIRTKVHEYGKKHNDTVLAQWHALFDTISSKQKDV
jgi:hypothetical protein